MLQQLDGGIDGHPVRHAHLHMVAEHLTRPTAEVVADAPEEHRVHIVDISLSIHRVAHAQALVPTFFTCLANVFQGIERVDREREFGQRSRHLSRQRVLAMAGVKGQVDLAREVGLVGHTRLEGVAQLVCGRRGVVFVEVGTHDVDVGREIAPRMRLGVLFVRPLDFEVGAFLIVSSAFGANLVDSETQRHRAIEAIAFVVAESRLNAP